MIRKLSTNRSPEDNIKLGTLTAFSAGMVNVTSVIIFFAFTSNVTGHYAILAQEIAKGNWYQAAIVFGWISLFFLGSFTSNLCIINSGWAGRYISHALPLLMEIACIVFVGIYLEFAYTESLWETELLVAVMLFAMGLQNGLTASISNSVVKTTHLTGLTTDLAILFSMLTKKRFREEEAVQVKTRLLLCILGGYMAGGILAGLVYYTLQNGVFFAVAVVLTIVVFYDYYYHLFKRRRMMRKQPFIRKSYGDNERAAATEEEDIEDLEEEVSDTRKVNNF